MKQPIYIDATPLFEPTLTGEGRLVTRLIDYVAAIAPVRLVTGVPADGIARTRLRTGLTARQEIRLCAEDHKAGCGDVHNRRDQILRRPSVPHDVAEARQSPGVCSTFTSSCGRRFAREVALLYDLAPVILPDKHHPSTVVAFRKYCSESIHQHDAIIAISECSRNDAEWVCGLPSDQISVGAPGPSHCVTSHLWQAPVTRRDDVALVVATREPRSNYKFLLDWFMTTERLPHGFNLWWVGSRSLLCDADWEPQSNPFQRHIRFFDTVPDAQLCRLYRSASFTVCASLYEGFGFPVLDSLRHGTPVLCSYNSALVDFAGPGVQYFDPCDAYTLDEAYTAHIKRNPYSGVRPDLDARCDWSRFAQLIVSLCCLKSHTPKVIP